MLRRLCREKTTLSVQDIDQLARTAAQLPLMAELTGCDVFIDCATSDGGAIVVAQARPSTVGSAYHKSVVGEYALPDKEPAVFHALGIQAPARDIKAITQEERAVRQDVVPILNKEDQCIAVLIREKDISGELLQEKKFQQLAQNYEAEDLSLRSSSDFGDETLLREVHHRIKNNLQLVASILNLQARRCEDGSTRKILRENVGRVLSIAAIHDIITKNTGDIRVIDSLTLLDQLRKNLQSFVPDGKRVAIQISGDRVDLTADVASSVSLVVNELISNALEHAFEGRETGNIQVSFCAGNLFHTVTVSDDGIGFDPASPRKGSLGLNLVDATVRDRLHGHISVHSDCHGSRMSFDFKTE